MVPPANRRLRLAVRLNHSVAWHWLWSVLCTAACVTALHGGVKLLTYCPVLPG
jgi:hypothetical protein